MRGLICLLIAAAVLLAACRASVPPPGPPLPEPDFQVDRSCWDPGRPARPRGKKYDGPIVDTHAHLHVPEEGGLTDQHLGDILAAARQAGVERLIFEPTPNQERFHAFEDGMEGMRRLAGLGPGLAGHHCGSDHMTVWMHFAFRNGFEPAELDRRLGRLEAELDGGPCAAIGEIGPYHFEKRDGQLVLHFPMSFEPFVELAGLAARKGVWLEIHAEPVTPDGDSYENDVFGGIALLFRRFPDLKLILAHTAMTNPANARALLSTYPNLMMNLKITPGNISWLNLGPVTNGRREIFEDWAALFEDMPGRFMVGTDTHFWRQSGGRVVTPERYRKVIKRLRRLLGSLDEAAARAIAYGNARRLWPDG